MAFICQAITFTAARLKRGTVTEQNTLNWSFPLRFRPGFACAQTSQFSKVQVGARMRVARLCALKQKWVKRPWGLVVWPYAGKFLAKIYQAL